MKRIKQSVVYWPGDFHCQRPMQHEDADFVFRGGRAFPKALTCGNYSTPQESPYGFGAHVVKGPIETFKGDDIVCDYNDRLQQFYPERWSEACKNLTSRFEHCKLSEASAFLSVLYQFEVKCLQIVMGCNVSNGYPYYIFISRRVDAADPASGDVA